jgi:DUF2911 family protein
VGEELVLGVGPHPRGASVPTLKSGPGETLRLRRSALSGPRFSVGTALGAVALIVLPACAQRIPLSQYGSVTQRVGTTDIAISYNRPVARGRELFGGGGIVAWGRRWHPGADSATTITFSAPVTVQGHELAAGSYTLWTIPQPAPEPWTIIFNKGTGVWHTNYPGEAQDALRVTAAAEQGQHMETLTFYFPVVAADSAVLRLHWGETMVGVVVRVRGEP